MFVDLKGDKFTREGGGSDLTNKLSQIIIYTIQHSQFKKKKRNHNFVSNDYINFVDESWR